MTDIIEVHNKATGRNEMIPADWLDNPVLNHDVNGDLLERVVPPAVVEQLDRPTESSTHEAIDAFAAQVFGEDYTWPAGTKSRADKMAVLDELAPPVEEEAPTQPTPPVNPDVQLAGPVSSESPYGQQVPSVNTTQAEDEEN